jgi:Na+-transporting NADH:ubiquinone oxidoreductase subunit C
MHKRRFLRTLAPAFLAGVTWSRSETYLSADQAKGILFPGQKLTQATLTLTAEQKKAIASASGVRVRSETVQAWRAGNGGWLIFDNVLGKHEYIDFALALNADGSVKGVEILTYRETYGGEIRNAKWRAQFTGKKAGAPLKLDDDIKNISGATLSCSHISEGIRRLVQTWAIALNK